MYKSKQTWHLWRKLSPLSALLSWGYSVIWNKINELDNSLGRVQHEGILLGDLSARMMHMEKFAEQAKADLDHLVEMQDAPITSDYQQFERLNYLEKELERLRR